MRHLWWLLLLATPVQAAPGPVPDYAPLARVRTHIQATDLAREFVGVLAQLLGSRYEVIGDRESAGSLIWLRDYQPIYTRDATQHLRAIHTRSLLPERNNQRFPGDPPPTELGLVLEHGNLVVAGERVFLTERVLDDNGGKGAGEAGVIARLATVLDRPAADIIILPQLPGESTGHIDLFLLPVADDTVLVPRILPEALEGLSESEWLIGHTAANFLDAQSERLAGMGLKVKRLSMLPPRIMPSVDSSGEDAVFFSPANALLLNIQGRRTVLLPDLHPSALRASHRRLFQQYRKQWAGTFQGLGWKPVFADATELARYLGFFRCLTAVVPE